MNAVAHAVVDDAEDRRIKSGYLRWLPERGRVLDVGCGRGSLLDVARQAGLQAVGIDRDAGAARERGFDAHEGELLAVLRAMAARGECFDGAVLAHVIEHQPGREAIELLQAIAAVLAPAAPLVVVTPNSRNYIVMSELFWLDPTHVRPYPRALLERLAQASGFTVAASFDDANTRPSRSPLRALVARLRSMLSGVDKSGPVDSVVVCRRS
ncbi:MAG TPA: class I SAM-dependent methyltransferase [Planctomycetota bacterium]|nr:class I SAM-dependent methyltransferase [Planctomycetota bacterium]